MDSFALVNAPMPVGQIARVTLTFGWIYSQHGYPIQSVLQETVFCRISKETQVIVGPQQAIHIYKELNVRWRQVHFL